MSPKNTQQPKAETQPGQPDPTPEQPRPGEDDGDNGERERVEQPGERARESVAEEA